MRLLPRFFQEIITSLRDLAMLVAGSVRSNASIAVLSLGLAFVLWIFVTETDTGTTRKGTLPIDIPVQAANLPRGLALASELPSVRVRVEVNENVWEELTPDDFDAIVPLTGLSEGNHTVPLEVNARTSRGGLRVLDYSPGEIDVLLVPLFSKTVPVSVRLTGSLPRGYSVGEASADPSTVTVSGTESLVNLVSGAVVNVDLTGQTSDINGRYPLEARDEQGLLVRGVSFDRREVGVLVVIDRQEFSQALAVSPVVTGVPATGYNVAGVSVDPPTVTVVGAEPLLDALSFIRTMPLDISGATTIVERIVQLDLPSGVSVGGSVQVKVRVVIEPALGQATFGAPVQLLGLAETLQLAGPPLTAQVTLQGLLPVLAALNLSAIHAAVDVSGLDTGSYTLTVSVTAPAGIQVVSVSPIQIAVTLQTR